MSNSSSSSFIIELISLNFPFVFLRSDVLGDVLDNARENDWDCDVYKNYLIATTTMDNFDFIESLITNYYMNGQNVISFGSYAGFYHDLDELKKFIDIFLYRK